MTLLSTNFSLEELTRSSTAVQYRLDNTPGAEAVEHLTRTAVLLEDVRALLGRPLRISSGYRSPAVNKAVGGAATSAHCLGHAVDFVCDGLTPYEVCQRIRDSGLLFDQLIHEYGRWTHIAFGPGLRRMPLTIAQASRGYLQGILPIRRA